MRADAVTECINHNFRPTRIVELFMRPALSVPTLSRCFVSFSESPRERRQKLTAPKGSFPIRNGASIHSLSNSGQAQSRSAGRRLTARRWISRLFYHVGIAIYSRRPNSLALQVTQRRNRQPRKVKAPARTAACGRLISHCNACQTRSGYFLIAHGLGPDDRRRFVSLTRAAASGTYHD